jgi:hypothetical protein
LWVEAASQRVATSHHIDINFAVATGQKNFRAIGKYSVTRTNTLREHPGIENIPRAE